MRLRLAWVALLGLSACGGREAAKSNPLLRQDLAEGRIVDLIQVKKLAGRRNFLIFSRPRYVFLAEGYIRGIITDYDQHPIQGVSVRGVVTHIEKKKKKKRSEEEALLLGLTDEEYQQKESDLEGSANFDVGVSDAEGVYRARFLFPLIGDRVDVRGKLLYNPGWDQQYEVLGQSYEPQIKESEFRLFYDSKTKIIAFSEGPRKTVVRPVRNIPGGKVSPIKLPGADKPETAKEILDEKKKKEPKRPGEGQQEEGEDFFKGFEFGL